MGKVAIALVPAGGRGQRMGKPLPKQFLELGGAPILVHSLRTLEASPLVGEIILAVPETEREYCLEHIVERHHFSKVTKVVPGGVQRQDSVRHALDVASQDYELVLVHDAVRPFLTLAMVDHVLRSAEEIGAALVALPMRDTVKRVDAQHRVKETVDRAGFWLAQTPQAFQANLLREVHRKAFLDQIHATDDAQLMEHYGYPVSVVEGDGENIKITRPEDLVIGEAILADRERRHKATPC